MDMQFIARRVANTMFDCVSVRKRPGEPADSQQAFSLAKPGKTEINLGFSGQA